MKFTQLGILVLLLTLFTLSCRNTDSPVPSATLEPLPTATPSAEPAATTWVEPTPTRSPVGTSTPDATTTIESPPADLPTQVEPSPTSVPVVDAGSMSVEDISLKSCDVNTADGSTHGFGTAPPATTDDANVNSDIDELEQLAVTYNAYLTISVHNSRLSPLATSLSNQPSRERQAALLQTLIDRYSTICDAVRNLYKTDATKTFVVNIQDSLIARFSDIIDKATELQSSEDDVITTENEFDKLFRDPLIARTDPVLQEIQSIVFTQEKVRSLVSAHLLLGQIEADPAWMTVSSNIRVILLAQIGLQQLSASGSGPANWGLGTAAKLFRIRNGATWDETQAISIIPAILGLTSGPSSSSVEIQPDEKLTRLLFELPEDSWFYFLEFVVGNEYTYVVQTGCPSALSSECETFRTEVWDGWSDRP